MSTRREQLRRSKVELGTRYLLAAGLTVAGLLASMGSLAQVLRSGNPERALMLAPGNARVIATLAYRRATDPKISSVGRRGVDQLSKAALLKDPTAVTAVAALGIDAQSRGRVIEARRLFAYAQRLSRREIVTQLWAIEDAVARSDIPAALRQYDIALRTSRTISDVLFPVLSKAITDPVITKDLARTLAAKPAWRDSLINYLGAQGADPDATVKLFMMLQQMAVPVSGMAQGAVINALMQKGQLDSAWSYYAAVRQGADRRRSRDPNFSAGLQSPTPLDWGLVDIAGGSTSIQRGGSGNVFDFSLAPSVGGALLQQVQMLPSGNYRLTGHSANLDQPQDSLPYWMLSCRDSRELGTVKMVNSGQANGVFTGQFSVPAGCPVQVLTLMAPPSTSTSGASGQIDHVQLFPLR